MTFEFLYSAKFSPPSTNTQLIERTSLLSKLETQIEEGKRLALLTAPSGYGKSTLLFQHRQTSQREGHNTAWLNLDASDNNEEFFIDHLCESIQREITKTTALEDNCYPQTSVRSRLAETIQSIENCNATFNLYIDEFQHLNDTQLLEQFDWFIHHAPHNLCVFIASRSTPELTILGEYRVKNGLINITATDLKFTELETQSFLSTAGINQFALTDIKEFHTKTEGWAAATQLLSLAIKEQDFSDKNQALNFVKQLSGSDKDIVQYLSASVFDLQNDEVQNFLLKSSPLRRFSAELCEGVCQIPNALSILKRVHHLGLFIFELDRNQRWFRYHPLFRDFLLEKLSEQYPLTRKEITTQAALWFAEKQQPEIAIDYYLEAGEFDQACKLINNTIVEAVQYRGDHNQLFQWMDRLPLDHVLSNINIAICYTWSLLFTRQLRRGSDILDALQKKYCKQDSPPDLLHYNLGMLNVIKLVMNGDFHQAKSSITDWQKNWKNAPTFEQAVVCGLLGTTCFHLMDLSQARASLSEAKAGFDKLHCYYGAAWMQAMYSRVYFQLGHINESLQILETAQTEAVQRMGQFSYANGLLSLHKSLVHCQQGNNSSALRHLQDGFDSIEHHGAVDTVCMAFIIKSRLEYRASNFQQALSTLTEGQTFGHQFNLLNFELSLVCERIFLFLRAGKIQQAEEFFIERKSILDQADDRLSTQDQLNLNLLKAKLLLCRDQASSSLAIISTGVRDTAHKGFHFHHQQYLLLQAAVHFSQNKKNLAFRTLKTLLEETSTENNIGLFIDDALLITPLLRAFFEKNSAQEVFSTDDNQRDFWVNLSKHFNLPTVAAKSHQSDTISNAAKFHLSKREQQLVELLQEGHSNKDLAERLFLSESTVKWHLSRVYAKIGAKNRVDAIKILTSH